MSHQIMGDIAGSISGSPVDFLLQNLISLCKEEIGLIRNFNKDLGKLKESLDMIQSFLNDAEKKQVTDEAVRRWLKKLEAVAFHADNVLDELSYEVLRNKVETGNKIKKKVLKFFSTWKMSRKIRDINENLKSINQEATDFGLQSQLRAHAPNFVSDSSRDRETHSYSIDPIVVGRENYVSRIVDILTSNNSTHEEPEVFSVLPIVGMGGLGKTTTAKLVFHDEKIKRHFEILIWVHVSENFDEKDLFKKILESLKQKVDLETKDALLRKIQETLEDKKYLLVLDDVWTEETRKWSDFREALSNISYVKGNGIIVTTRSERVASIMGTIRVPELSKLSDEECWSIIKGKAFLRSCVIPSQFETIGRKIAKRCQGLPLAANVLGGLLYGKSKEEWHSIEEKRLSDLGEDGNSVMKILKLSFDNLPTQSLKKCFAFCSIFPTGFEIRKDMLIYLWMAEGFVGNDQGEDMEIVGQKYIDLFLQKSLFQTSWKDLDGSIKSYKMHDLVHDLASSISHESGPVRFMYMKSDRDISKEEGSNLRSLVIEGKFSENIFACLKCIRGLVLIGHGNKELPKMEHLIHLRYLDISSTRVKYLPRSIGNLYHLQTLRANINVLNKVPKTLKELINLRHLHMVKPGFLEELKIEEMPMLGHLQHLKSLHLESLPNGISIGSSSDGIHNEGVGKDKIIVFPALKSLSLSSSFFSMTELLTIDESQKDSKVVAFPHLESLNLDCIDLSSAPIHFPCLKELKIKRMRNSEFLENLLCNLTSLTRIDFHGVEGLVCFPDMFFSNNNNLSYLKIKYSRDLKHLPSLVGSSLREIDIRYCENLEELPNNLHCLNSLEKLVIWSCPNLKSIPYNPSGEGHESIQDFTSLRELTIYGCDSLSELPSGLTELCKSLETMWLWKLPSVTNLVEVVGCLQKMPHLTKLNLDLRYIPESDYNNFPIDLGSLRSLRYLRISCGMENWEHVQDQLQHLTNLRYLSLENLEIEAVPEWLGNLSSLNKLNLEECPKLRSLPFKKAMKRLTWLRIHNCRLLNVQSEDDNSEWHKISHISYVDVYPEQIVSKESKC